MNSEGLVRLSRVRVRCPVVAYTAPWFSLAGNRSRGRCPGLDNQVQPG
ncbi:hypothetical protein ES703_66474 [subsurface metagenome]